jgi:DNA-binding transcriptional regulator YiaG
MTPTELRRIRKRLGLTQRQLAALVDVHWVTARRWEASMRRIPNTTAKLIRLLAAQRRTR